jgi:protein-L-isoaspartate(D-aspartate) O-methyltransferase
MARQNIERNATSNGDLFLTTNTEIKLSNGWDGDQTNAPFDVIHVGAAARVIPQTLVDQLKIGGIMVIPVEASDRRRDGQLFQYVEKLSDGSIRTTPLLGVRYVPLIEHPFKEH